MSISGKHTSPSEMKFLISKLKEKIAYGYDLITNRILNNLPKKTIILITFIFNSMLRISYIPSMWKLSTIIVIPKPNKPKNEITSYRPITLTKLGI